MDMMLHRIGTGSYVPYDNTRFKSGLNNLIKELSSMARDLEEFIIPALTENVNEYSDETTTVRLEVLSENLSIIKGDIEKLRSKVGGIHFQQIDDIGRLLFQRPLSERGSQLVIPLYNRLTNGARVANELINHMPKNYELESYELALEKSCERIWEVLRNIAKESDILHSGRVTIEMKGGLISKWYRQTGVPTLGPYFLYFKCIDKDGTKREGMSSWSEGASRDREALDWEAHWDKLFNIHPGWEEVGIKGVYSYNLASYRHFRKTKDPYVQRR